MKKMFGIVLAVFAMFGTVTATAGDIYITGQATYTDNDDLDNSNGAGVGIGYSFTEWFAVEATYDYLGVGKEADGFKFDGNSIGVWAVADPTITKIGSMPLKAIGRVGVTRTELNSNEGDVDDTNLAYGVGLGLGVTKNVDVLAGYTWRTVDVGGADLDMGTASVGLKYTF